MTCTCQGYCSCGCESEQPINVIEQAVNDALAGRIDELNGYSDSAKDSADAAKVSETTAEGYAKESKGFRDQTEIIYQNAQALVPEILEASQNVEDAANAVQNAVEIASSVAIVRYPYTVIGGETTIVVPDTYAARTVQSIDVEGFRQYPGYGYTYDAANQTVTMDEPFESDQAGTVVMLLLGTLNADSPETIYSNLASASGASMVGTTTSSTVQVELDNIKTAANNLTERVDGIESNVEGVNQDLVDLKKRFAYIDDYEYLVTSGDWTTAINAAFATGLTVVGTQTYQVNGIINSKGQNILGKFKINTTRYSLGEVLAQTISPDDLSIRMLYLESAYDLSELLYIKSLGFNTINHYCYFANNGSTDATGTAEQLLNNALTAGIQVNLGTESPRANADLAEFVNATKDHPAVFGYSVYDEPAARGISITDQDKKITTLRTLTNKPLSFVDLLTTQPFNQVFSVNYDIAFVDSYSVRYTTGTAADWLKKDLAKMRYDFGGIKAMTGLERVIPVVSAFLDAGASPYYSNNEAQVIAASKVFGTVGGGNFGAFVWDGMSANFPGNVRNNKNLQNLVKGLAAQKVRKKLETDAYLFGGTQASTIWPLTQLYKVIPAKDPNTSDANVAGSAFPVRVRSGSADTDRTINTANVDYSGIGFKGSFTSFLTTIQARSNVRCIMESFNVIGSTNGNFSLYTTDDCGYTITLRYVDAVSGNKVLDFNTEIPKASAKETLILRQENSGDTYPYYRKFLRGLIVCCDW